MHRLTRIWLTVVLVWSAVFIGVSPLSAWDADDDLLPIDPDSFDDGLLPLPGQEVPDDLLPVPGDELPSGPISDGEYTGALGLGGSFWLEVQQLGVRWTGEGRGTVSMTVQNGVADGTWEMSGGALLEVDGLPAEIQTSGSSRWTSQGTIGGEETYLLTGSGEGESTSTVVTPVTTQTRTESYPIPEATIELELMAVVCGQLAGRWDHVIEQSFEGTPVAHTVSSYLVLVPSGEAIGGYHFELAELVHEANLVSVYLDDPDVTLDRVAEVIGDAERLLVEMADDVFVECVPTDDFWRLISGVVQDIMNTYLAHWVGQGAPIDDPAALRRLLELGYRAGAIGSGSPHPGTSLFLELQATDLVARELAVLAEEGDYDSEHICSVLPSAVLLGVSVGELTAADVALALGC